VTFGRHSPIACGGWPGWQLVAARLWTRPLEKAHEATIREPVSKAVWLSAGRASGCFWTGVQSGRSKPEGCFVLSSRRCIRLGRHRPWGYFWDEPLPMETSGFRLLNLFLTLSKSLHCCHSVPLHSHTTVADRSNADSSLRCSSSSPVPIILAVDKGTTAPPLSLFPPATTLYLLPLRQQRQREPVFPRPSHRCGVIHYRQTATCLGCLRILRDENHNNNNSRRPCSGLGATLYALLCILARIAHASSSFQTLPSSCLHLPSSNSLHMLTCTPRFVQTRMLHAADADAIPIGTTFITARSQCYCVHAPTRNARLSSYLPDSVCRLGSGVEFTLCYS
jgi:hypothetical protein